MTKTKALAIAVAFILSVACAALLFQPIAARAGATKVYVSAASSINEAGINEGDFLLSGGVYGADGKAVFDETCSNTAKLIGKARINNLKDYGMQTLFTCNSTINILEFGESGKLSFCFGLNSLRDSAGAENSLEIAFSQGTNGVKVEINEYFEAGVASPVYSEEFTSVFSAGEPFVLQAEQLVDGTFSLSVGGLAALEGRRLATVAEGYCGIISVGKNTAEISDTEIVGYRYDTPETVDYFEDFSNNGYNSNMFYSESTASALSPSSLSVIDGELAFRNTARAFFSTRYTYSNFTIEFDITHLQREAEYDENGTPTALISNWFGIAFGMESIDLSSDETVRVADWLHFEGVPSISGIDHTVPYSGARYVLFDQGSAVKVQSMSAGGSIPLWNNEVVQDRVINLRLSVIDGVVSLYLKYAEDASFGDPCFSYELGATRTGYVRIFSWGAPGMPADGIKYICAANFRIDNLSIKNEDYEGVRNLTDPPAYKTNVVAGTPDYDYGATADDGDLLENKLVGGAFNADSSGCNGAAFGADISVAAVLCGAAALSATIRKKGRRG